MKKKVHGVRAISDEAVKEKTGKTTKQWTAILDKWDCVAQGHTRTARHLRDHYGLSPWWSQAITGRYEWAKGVKKE